ncbi:flagellar biosynthesis protein FlhB [Pseudomonas turukhanskensis]|uniref:Flagellar biosynthetic protein FlhB n=1 Tax=Pseudomonas turukhanskensis TaxID=1806536 RepID=A0A9W6NHY2_9PSED|nr:flagellar biosynthesis protein FlhB [Pseudomonas turukhanskensis]GLK91573.1 flagellar biosynthesis protein FlhB [Pseudomonas turukhanskensis]
MAENENGAEKSEEPTDKRRRESREKGQIARSRELNTFAVLVAGVGGLMSYGGAIGNAMIDIMKDNFTLSRELLMNDGSMALQFENAVYIALMALFPLFIVLLVASILGPIALGGWLFSAQSMAPNFGRMNPLPGLKRMFSAKAGLELLKALAKFVLVLIVALVVLKADTRDLLALANEPLESAILHSITVVGRSAMWMAWGLLFIVAVDVPFQLYDNRQKMLMTKQEVRDEYKDSEGKPEVKQRIRQMQREMAERRMMAAVPQADVVITNPTHFAVALKYDPLTGGAPVLLAKGGDFMALKIREIANEHKVMVLESPGLARAIFHSTELDREIPAGLYLAVAQVLAYVYQLRQFRSGKGKRPDPLKDLPIPPDLRRDE